MLTCLIIAGCQKEETTMQTALDFRTELLSAGGCHFLCDVQADYGEKVYSFSLDCEYDGEDARLTVLQPENISGISATVHGEDATVEFDGISLQFGELAKGKVAPLSIPWLLGSAWTKDYISYSGQDGEHVRLTCLKGYDDNEITIDTWLSDGIPVNVEVSYDGQRVLSATIREFSFQK